MTVEIYRMWIPESERELRELISSDKISETATLEFKREPGKNNKEIAKDIAAMTTAGGVIIYGVKEDEHKRPTILNPIPFAGLPERITAIASSGISEPPAIYCLVLKSEDDPAKGYIVVHVPPSPRAPHMVQSDGDNRYYGRDDRGNRILTEGEVARLYERRKRWERDREEMLDAAITDIPLKPHPSCGYIYLVAEPVIESEDILARALGLGQQGAEIKKLLRESRLSSLPPVDLPFDLGHFERTSGGWLISMSGRPDGEHGSLMSLELRHEGGGRFFCSEAAGIDFASHNRLIFEERIADWVMQFLSLVGGFYGRAKYFGAVDLGVAIMGIEGAYSGYSYRNYEFDYGMKYDKSTYRRTFQAASSVELRQKPKAVAGHLLNRLFTFTTRGCYSPFDDPQTSR